MSDINGSKAVKGNDKRHGKAGNRRSGNRRIPRSSKELLGYDSMLSNGIAYLGGDRWSVSLRISDINYQVATQDQQLDVVDRWGRFLNSVGENMGVQITVATRMLDPEEVTRSIAMPLRGDMLDGLRGDFNRNVRRRLAGRSQGAVTDKYLTPTLRERDGERAVTLLNRAVLRATAQLRSVGGCVGVRLDRRSRLEVLHGMLRRGTRFMFDEDGFLKSHGMSTKDYVAPFAVDVSDRRRLRLSSGTTEVWHQCLLVRDFPDYLSDQLVSSITDIKADITVGIHLSPRGKAEGLKLVNRTIAEMDMQAIDERRKNRKQHLPEDMLPHDLQESMSQAGELRDDLEHNGDRLVDSLMIVDVSADSREQLGQTVRDVTAAIDGQSCVAETLAYMQVEGLNAVLPLGNPLPPMRRTLTTSSAAILVPFTSQELFEPGGVFHGANARTGNPVVIDRTKGMNGNGFILGTTGSGKSQAAKNEITQIYLTRPDDDLIVIDPEHEFTPLCDGLGGERVEIGESSRAHINALDIEYEDDSEGDPIRSKCASVLNMLGVLIGGQDGIDRMQRSLIDRTVIGMYREVREHPELGMPTLATLHDRLAALGEPGGRDAARALEIYATGSLNAFSHATDVDTSSRFLVYDVSGLGAELRTFGMLVVLDQIWNRVVRNRRLGRRTWLWVDEFHLLFSNRYAAEYFLRLYKRARKWGLSPTGITQNIEELLIRPNGRIPGLRVRHINGISSAHGPAGPKRPRAMNRNGGPEAPHPNGTTPIDAAERGIDMAWSVLESQPAQEEDSEENNPQPTAVAGRIGEGLNGVPRRKSATGGTMARVAAGRRVSAHARRARRSGKAARSGGRRARSAAKASTQAARQAIRMVARTAMAVKAGITAAASATVGVPILLGAVAVLMIVSLLLWFIPTVAAGDGGGCEAGVIEVPDEAKPWVSEAARSSGLGADFIAALMEQESGFRPDAYADDSNGGTWGLLQMNRSVWRGVHPDGADQTPPEGITDTMVHAHYGGMYLKNRLEGVKQLKAAHPDMPFAKLDDLTALVIAHNAGEGNLMKYPDIPSITKRYLDNVRPAIDMGGGCSATAGRTIGKLAPPLAMQPGTLNVDVAATGTPVGRITTYATGQCTWWAAARRLQIGKPVDGYMGDGWMWASSARKLG